MQFGHINIIQTLNNLRLPSPRIERDSSAALRAVGTFDPRKVVLVEEPSLAGSYPGGFEELAVAHEGDRIALLVS